MYPMCKFEPKITEHITYVNTLSWCNYFPKTLCLIEFACNKIDDIINRSTRMSFVCTRCEKHAYQTMLICLYKGGKKYLYTIWHTEKAISLHDALLGASTYLRTNMPQSSLKHEQECYHITIMSLHIIDNSKHFEKQNYSRIFLLLNNGNFYSKYGYIPKKSTQSRMILTNH